ncbi:cytochrome ubiquinol oxidase subunit I [Conexibacter sp. JD483]|uniref:cytochrome ubiquinol oxidase subunit I n=1 Tax=unclassified Conexibacter TaxID=2627773 RepID=UPI00272050DF|nr:MULTISPECIES: cytochrome ubiquinol oxidase subunit I [unclassified Conexibacter]MDO8188717.1 cytochrome ubiquinol oxidase subunit I [Conexibacter sp. CPCC 205706]MDO8201244.1 cytochrome ubiquinol oxidase subunit I [Conexibacter sp. CPCC 205762]MDR9370932.1 cytochrome ubiquinol oxidase subunit I [Conexibacter sp. JD483]
MNSLDLARWQFGLTTLLHFAVVGISIGLVLHVAWQQTRWHRTGDERYLRLTRFYGKLMLLSFAVGVVTGILQSFQFGMNWSRFSAYVGDVFGAPLALEGLGAFFVEAVFLGLWMFGWGRLPRRLHLACLWIVAGAAVLSAYAILVANTWMQHPVGYELVDGRAQLTNVLPVLFNLNLGLTVAHVLFGALLAGTTVVLAVAALQLLRGRDVEVFRPFMAFGLKVGLVAALGAATFGHFQGMLALKQQPMKMAAAEALYETESPAGLSLFALGGVSTDPGRLLLDIKLPVALSVLNDFSLSSTVRGIDELQAEAEARYGPGNYTPVVGLMYWSFRTMVGGGTALIGLLAFGLWLLWRGTLFRSRRYLRLLLIAPALPLLAQAGGWILREGGRQPWIVEGLLRTDVANSPNVGVVVVALSLAGYLAVYGLAFFFAGRTALHEVDEGLEGEHSLTPAPGAARRASSDLALTY